MLILSRKKNQQVLFPHLGIKVEILRVAGNTVSLGIEAPKSVQILRGELCSGGNDCETKSGIDHNRIANQPTRSVLHQVRNQLHQAQMIVALAQKQLESGQAENPEVVLDEMLRRLNELDKKTTPSLPVASTATVPATATVPSTATVSGKHALLVEDDANERALLAAYLRLSGFTVTEAGDGVEAMAVLAQQTVDLVVLDIHMPRMNGLETLQAMRRQSTLNRTKVVVVSGEDRERLVRDEDIGGADVVSQWFAKPLNPVHLVNHLQAVTN